MYFQVICENGHGIGGSIAFCEKTIQWPKKCPHCASEQFAVLTSQEIIRPLRNDNRRSRMPIGDGKAIATPVLVQTFKVPRDTVFSKTKSLLKPLEKKIKRRKK